MKKDPISIFFRVLIVAITLTSLAKQANASQEEAVSHSTPAPVIMTGVPALGGHGPGMGRGYQRQTPGPGQGSPGYRGGYLGDPAYAVRQPNPPINSLHRPEAFPQSRQYDRPGYWRGGRGYGAGYPGYRGHGGTRYPQHRQYGNPPSYPAVFPDEQAVPQQ